jgi:hypothetical protein
MPNLLQMLLADVAAVIACVCHIDHSTILYIAAAIIARFWHEHVWMVYIAMSYMTIIGLHH